MVICSNKYCIRRKDVIIIKAIPVVGDLSEDGRQAPLPRLVILKIRPQWASSMKSLGHSWYNEAFGPHGRIGPITMPRGRVQSIFLATEPSTLFSIFTELLTRSLPVVSDTDDGSCPSHIPKRSLWKRPGF